MVEQCSSGGEASPTGLELLFTDDKLPGRILHSLNMMRKNRTFCDVVLHVSFILSLTLTLDNILESLNTLEEVYLFPQRKSYVHQEHFQTAGHQFY